MNVLSYPIRIYEKSEDHLVIMVPHEPNDNWGEAKLNEQVRTDQTRDFVKWLRKTFKDVPNEFRYMNKKQIRDWRYRSIWSARRYKTINADKHFVVYGLTRKQMMMIKLVWQFKTETAGTSSNCSFLVGDPSSFEPSQTLKDKLEAAK
jgi:hypothetical protein